MMAQTKNAAGGLNLGRENLSLSFGVEGTPIA
jgi:hypothetical protein